MAKQKDIIGIILAAGKGTRFKSDGTNKTASLFRNKPLIQFGLDLYTTICSNTIVVIGAYADSVMSAVSRKDNLIFASQRKRLGTGHALMVAVKEIEKNNLHPRLVLLGYGDHMMHYTKEIVSEMLEVHTDSQTVISLITTNVSDPSSLAWGRIIRNEKGYVTGIVEEKDATPEEKQITELNAGFYCFDYAFLQKNGKKIKKSPVTGEYYITDLIGIAVGSGKNVKALSVPFENVGLGINTRDDLEKSQSHHSKGF
jgi:bifunctional UDP-N-acetylglucosamine pyrophosphorylase / glucosamine-1-phosphate N-acetyltransferase